MATVARVGFASGVLAGSATIAYDVVQLLQVAGAVHFPLDEILIFGTSLCIIVPFVLEMVALHYATLPEKQLWTHAALVFTTLYAVFGAANYVVQLTTVIPAEVRGAGASVEVLRQTPHSLLWDFDAIAYIAMGIASWLIIPAVANRRVRLACMANVVATALAGVVYFSPTFSTKLLFVGLPWGITAPLFMLTLAAELRTRSLGGPLLDRLVAREDHITGAQAP